MSEQIVNKLKKLIAHEASARKIGNVDEAAAFATRIHELLVKYKLSLEEIDLTHQGDLGGLDVAAAREPWQECLVSEIARSYFCEAIVRTAGGKPTIVVIGTAADREIVAELYLYFEKLATELAQEKTNDYREAVRFHNGLIPERKVASYRQSFLIGFTAAVCQRFDAARKNAAEQIANSTALVKSDQRLQEYVDQLQLQEHATPDQPKIHPDGFEAGHEAGRDVALTNKTLKE